MAKPINPEPISGIMIRIPQVLKTRIEHHLADIITETIPYGAYTQFFILAITDYLNKVTKKMK